MRHISAKSHPIAGSRAWSQRVLMGLAIVSPGACTNRPLGDGDGGDASTGALTTSTGSGSTGPIVPTSDGVTGEPSTSTSTGPAMPGTSGVDTGVDSCPFICEPDLPPNNTDCPGTQQLDPECPEGFKCTLEESLGNTQCLEVVPDPKGLYEPCTVIGDWLSGHDDCGLGMLCWNVDERGQGTCIGLCNDPGDGLCVCTDPNAMPTWCQECAVGLCIPGCDPLIQDCINPNDVCVPVNDGFSCVLDASGDEGQANDPCEFINTCDKGLACLDSATASAACDPQVSGCCQPFCELPGAPCPNPDRACAPWFPPGEAPAGQENVGICMIPK